MTNTEKHEILKATQGLLNYLKKSNRELSETLNMQKKTTGRQEGIFFILNK